MQVVQVAGYSSYAVRDVALSRRAMEQIPAQIKKYMGTAVFNWYRKALSCGKTAEILWKSANIVLVFLIPIFKIRALKSHYLFYSTLYKLLSHLTTLTSNLHLNSVRLLELWDICKNKVPAHFFFPILKKCFLFY